MKRLTNQRRQRAGPSTINTAAAVAAVSIFSRWNRFGGQPKADPFPVSELIHSLLSLTVLGRQDRDPEGALRGEVALQARRCTDSWIRLARSRFGTALRPSRLRDVTGEQLKCHAARSRAHFA
jgi:hypothetical protein